MNTFRLVAFKVAYFLLQEGKITIPNLNIFHRKHLDFRGVFFVSKFLKKIFIHKKIMYIFVMHNLYRYEEKRII